MSYRVEQTDQFRADFREALSYIVIRLKNPTAAYAFADEFERIAGIVSEFPHMYSFWGDAGELADTYRFVRVKNYLAFYVVLDDTVEFRRFLYARADLSQRLTQ